jgi:hypothetical protein
VGGRATGKREPQSREPRTPRPRRAFGLRPTMRKSPETFVSRLLVERAWWLREPQRVRPYKESRDPKKIAVPNLCSRGPASCVKTPDAGVSYKEGTPCTKNIPLRGAARDKDRGHNWAVTGARSRLSERAHGARGELGPPMNKAPRRRTVTLTLMPISLNMPYLSLKQPCGSR